MVCLTRARSTERSYHTDANSASDGDEAVCVFTKRILGGLHRHHRQKCCNAGPGDVLLGLSLLPLKHQFCNNRDNSQTRLPKDKDILSASLGKGGKSQIPAAWKSAQIVRVRKFAKVGFVGRKLRDLHASARIIVSDTLLYGTPAREIHDVN